MGTSDHSFFVK